ncbi:hypothetical protein [Streptomyces sp. V4I2]|uniref:hypothetical protein n=1 Tax=Streptomyces sp. V4I2 TaxID=3042280 RepID=UPI002787F8C7|nr:hypothetical protein [Streptomyces sp. V4I2]MDQ1045368.1 hypothetical protein [Streptomyces sp. V4I2]
MSAHLDALEQRMGKKLGQPDDPLLVSVRSGAKFTKRRRMTVPGGHVEEGDLISIDGSSGKVYLGEVPVVPSPVVEYFLMPYGRWLVPCGPWPAEALAR